MKAVVTRKERVADQIFLFEFSVAHEDYVPATPGSHLSVRISPEMVRTYSLTREAVAHTNRYEVAVQRCEEKNSGSRLLCDEISVGQEVDVGKPINRFAIVREAQHHVLVGGGIGITPLLSMARFLFKTKISFEAHFAFSVPERAPFLEELLSGPLAPQTTVYFSQSSSPSRLNLPNLLSQVRAGSVVYLCGPARMVQEGQMLCQQRRQHLVFESFSPLAAATLAGGDYEVVLQRSGARFQADGRRSLLDQVLENGGTVDSSCKSGTCGTCVTKVISGEIIHRDSCLYPDEQEAGDQIVLCVSTARENSVLVLDA